MAGFVTSSSSVLLKTRRVGQRCTLNLSRTETSTRWCGLVISRGGRPRHLTMVQNDEILSFSKTRTQRPADHWTTANTTKHQM
ncbi:hypothetical protein TNCV_1424231 [Trichonephila clavipes]|nr:hypothetical protein TNCV_1424231 [Trichonephila clavipes]